jgi:nucleotide-binding universal stress UspA family protein
MKTILFPTDFTQASVNAIGFAAAIARLLSAKMVLLYAVRSFADRDKFIASAAFDNEDQAEEALKKIAATFADEVPCQYLVKTGIVSDEIASVAKELEASLIIMGTSGAGEIPDALAILNSTTTELISKKICPVLAIPATARAQPLRKIVVAVDTEPIVATVLAPVIGIAKEANAEVLLLTVIPGEKISGDDLLANKDATIESMFSGLTYSLHAIQSEEVIDSIREFAEAQQADLLTVIARKRGFFDLLFHESVSQKLALHSQIPLLVLPE